MCENCYKPIYDENQKQTFKTLKICERLYTTHQLEEILQGVKQGLPPRQIHIYARRELTANQMAHARELLVKQTPEFIVQNLIEDSFNTKLLEYVTYGVFKKH